MTPIAVEILMAVFVVWAIVFVIQTKQEFKEKEKFNAAYKAEIHRLIQSRRE